MSYILSAFRHGSYVGGGGGDDDDDDDDDDKKETDKRVATLDGPMLLRSSPFSCVPQTTSEPTYSRFNTVMSVETKTASSSSWISCSPLQTVRLSVCKALCDVSSERTAFDKSDKTITLVK
jgi:hypothetical protein